MPLANRTSEIELFQQIVAGDNPKRILLIEGESGVGKSKLLAQFIDLCPPEISCVPIDLKSAQLGIPYLLSTVRESLGTQNFSQLSKQVKEFSQSGNVNVQVSDNQMIGQDQQINLVLNVAQDTREFRLVALREAFFRDLWAIEYPIVIIFDTFNEAPPELAGWLGGDFLSKVVRTPNLRVVIAGQTVPEPTIEWMRCCESRRLEAIRDVDAWWAFAQNQQLPFSKDAVEALMIAFHGQPREIDIAFATVARELRR